mmetsp:Transcript_25028/g.45297  ORF Transcript_25028/g.45297 Transcript_25028/m.45297 type:complete len:451 (-) Transcript_25028:887-2239(-)
MWAFFYFSMFMVSIAIFYLLRRYSSRTVTLGVKTAAAYAWLTSMAVVAIVPVDVYSTLNGKKPVELGIMWNFAYWSTQALTWLVLPFFQYYAEAGDFTVGRKCLTSLKENGILYGSVAAVGIIGIAILLFTRTLSYESLLGLGIGLSNAFGLISSILLLGYGLVSIPRKLWKSCPEMNLKWCAHRAARHAANVMRSTREMEDVVTIVMANERQLRRHDPLRKYMDVVLEELRKESPISPNDISSNNIDLEGLRAEDLEYNYDRDGLASLRRRMRAAINEYNGNRALYERVIIEAFEYEDVMNARRIHDFSHPPLRRRPLLSGVSSSSTSANNNNNSASPNGSSSLMSLEDRMAAAAAAAMRSSKLIKEELPFGLALLLLLLADVEEEETPERRGRRRSGGWEKSWIRRAFITSSYSNASMMTRSYNARLPLYSLIAARMRRRREAKPSRS